jgi:hypothetical protein
MRRTHLVATALAVGLACATLGSSPASAHPATEAEPTATVVLDTEYTLDLDQPDADDEALILGRYGNTFPRDADGQVPERYGNFTGCRDGVIGRATYVTNPVRWQIVYDTCEMRRLGAGPNDWGRLRAHERAHTRGWGHYEAPRRDNPAYYPRVRICGC